jgi:hypothetical protein
MPLREVCADIAIGPPNVADQELSHIVRWSSQQLETMRWSARLDNMCLTLSETENASALDPSIEEIEAQCVSKVPNASSRGLSGHTHRKYYCEASRGKIALIVGKGVGCSIRYSREYMMR